jgi:hypothetical protein
LQRGKPQIVLKESQETVYRLELLVKAGLLQHPVDDDFQVLTEAVESNKMIAGSVITAKQSKS